ncbi:N/A [soil metagenome]
MLIRRLLTLLLFTLAVAIAAWWFLQLRAPAPVIAPATVSLPAAPAIDPTVQGKLFGERTLTASAVNVTVKGVLAAVTSGGAGMALLAVDDSPPRAYSTGQFVARGTQVIEVRRDVVVLDQGGARVELTVPASKPLATGGIVRKAPPAR